MNETGRKIEDCIHGEPRDECVGREPAETPHPDTVHKDLIRHPGAAQTADAQCKGIYCIAAHWHRDAHPDKTVGMEGRHRPAALLRDSPGPVVEVCTS